MKIFDFLKPAPHIARLSDTQIDSSYRKYRINNFIGIFIGYLSYYLLRGNFSIAKPFFSSLGLTKSQMGYVSAALFFSYGISKFIMGNLSDRSNPRYFIVAGLIISIIINLIFGLATVVATSLFIMCILMFINGCAQGMGASPCYRTIAHWFTANERGRIMSMWNISHNIGFALLSLISIFLINIGWQSMFYIPAIIASINVAFMIIMIRDTPQSVGLMPIEEYKNVYPENSQKGINYEQELSAKEILFKYVLVNRYVWYLALANMFVYFIRHGISDWSTLYLTEIKHLNITSSFLGSFIYEIAGAVGMLTCGLISDKLFKGKRAPVSIISLGIACLGVLLYWRSTHVIVSYFSLSLIGMFIYGPLMLAGAQILDIIPKKAVGTTMGLLGIFGYWGGTSAATIGFGKIIDKFSWNVGFAALIASGALAITFFSMTISVKDTK